MKSIFILLSISLSIIFASFSSNETEKWELFKELDGISVYQSISHCNTEYNTANNEYYVFKYTNSNKYDVRLNWKLDLYYNNICRSCNLPSPNEYELSLDLKAGETLTYICSDESLAFKIFKSSKAGNIEPDIKFNFTNFTVSKL
jgi:hypothetical protein